MTKYLIKKAEECFGKQYKEFKNLIQSDTFFSKSTSLSEYKLINSQKLVQKYYFKESYYELLCDIPYEYYHLDFESIEEEAISIITNIEMKYKDKIYYLIESVSKKNGWWDLGKDELGSRGRYVEWIAADFERFFQYKTITSWVRGKIKSNFLEEQLNLYYKGGFPCGWEGNYPNGKMIAFQPEYVKKPYINPQLP